MNNALFPMAILAGGLATRLRPLTERIPKALIELNGEPFINHQLRLLRRSGINHVILCVAYLAKDIEKEVGDGKRFGLDIVYSYDGDELMGTGGAIRRALPKLGECFFVMYGDSYLECDFAKVQSSFVKSTKTGLMTVYRNEGRWDASNVEFAHNDILVYDKVNRTPSMKHIDYGLGVFRKTAFLSFPETEPFDIVRIYKTLLSQHDLAAYEVTSRFYEIGSNEGILELAEYLKTKKKEKHNELY
jgi:NDP-sugar pyrophosphorylase family protein